MRGFSTKYTYPFNGSSSICVEPSIKTALPLIYWCNANATNKQPCAFFAVFSKAKAANHAGSLPTNYEVTMLHIARLCRPSSISTPPPRTTVLKCRINRRGNVSIICVVFITGSTVFDVTWTHTKCLSLRSCTIEHTRKAWVFQSEIVFSLDRERPHKCSAHLPFCLL